MSKMQLWHMYTPVAKGQLLTLEPVHNAGLDIHAARSYRRQLYRVQTEKGTHKAGVDIARVRGSPCEGHAVDVPI